MSTQIKVEEKWKEAEKLLRECFIKSMEEDEDKWIYDTYWYSPWYGNVRFVVLYYCEGSRGAVLAFAESKTEVEFMPDIYGGLCFADKRKLVEQVNDFFDKLCEKRSEERRKIILQEIGL